MTDINERMKLAPKRVDLLIEKYPVVAGAVLIAGFLFGLLFGWLVWA